MADRRNTVPVRRMDDFSVVDSEFDNIRERFDDEMRKMEADMDRFRSDLMDREADFFKRATKQSAFGDLRGSGSKRSSSHTSSSVRSSRSETTNRKVLDGKEVVNERESFSSSTEKSSGGGGSFLGGSGLGGHSNWLQGLDSPLIKNSQVKDGEKELKLRFDVSQYTPEEIMVKTVDNKLLVHAKHEEKGEGKNVFREYNREFLLPSGTDPETIRSSLSKDGILTVEAPLPQQAITHQDI